MHGLKSIKLKTREDQNWGHHWNLPTISIFSIQTRALTLIQVFSVFMMFWHMCCQAMPCFKNFLTYFTLNFTQTVMESFKMLPHVAWLVCNFSTQVTGPGFLFYLTRILFPVGLKLILLSWLVLPYKNIYTDIRMKT